MPVKRKLNAGASKWLQECKAVQRARPDLSWGDCLKVASALRRKRYARR